MKLLNQLALLVVATSALQAGAIVKKAEKIDPLPIHSATTINIVEALAKKHYVSTRLDDAMSAKVLDSYIERLDPTRSYFLASDIADFERHRDQLDDSLQAGELTAAFEIYNRYLLRQTARFEEVLVLLEGGIGQFDFDRVESLELDRKESPWAQNIPELNELWRRRIKHSVLNLRLSKKEDDKIIELLTKRYNNRLSRARQWNSEDVFQSYMNAFTKAYDPHTQYLSPRTSESFNIAMSLSLEGIGAVLSLEDEHTKVISLVPAGPADKTKQLHPDDRIIGVGQGLDGEMVDVIGWRLDEVVELIRGKKDTIVRLNIIPASAGDGGESKEIQITRNTVKLEEQSAKSEIIEVEQFGATHKVGVIDIPAFYIDFRALQQGDRNYRSTTRDVQRLLVDLMRDGVEGVIIDLRDNGGGALHEANSLVGLFIERGPTVQVRNKTDRVDILNDRDIRTIYDGPLVVLVNRLSASASEIFAGAMQDYQRGLVVGTQTFGKGTVQQLIPLNHGQLKLTQAKFYRVSGESTQHNGVMPDIVFPASYDPDSIGESTLDDPLPWDRITPTHFQARSPITHLIPELRSLHRDRAAADPDFSYLRAAFDYRQERGNLTSITLNHTQRVKDREKTDAFWLGLENTRRVANGEDVIASLDELNPATPPTVAAAGGATGITTTTATEAVPGSNNEATSTIRGDELATVTPTIQHEADTVPADKPAEEAKEDEDPDAFLVESGNILLDFITLDSRTASQSPRRRQL